MKKTIIVNLFAGPGTGKSTTAAEIYVSLKKAGINVELVREFAKDLVWKGEIHEYTQESIAKGQKDREDMLLGKVDVIVTDSPYIQGMVYSEIGEGDRIYGDYIKHLQRGGQLSHISILLERTKEYIPKGREQSEEEARYLDEDIEDLLENYSIMYKKLTTNKAVPYATYMVMRLLEALKEESK